MSLSRVVTSLSGCAVAATLATGLGGCNQGLVIGTGAADGGSNTSFADVTVVTTWVEDATVDVMAPVPDGPAPADAGAASAPDASGPVATGPDAFSASDVAAAKARCQQPDGDATIYASEAEVNNLLIGSWWCCPLAPDAGTLLCDSGQAGYAFDSNGIVHTLLPSGAGGLLVGETVAATGTWMVGGQLDSQYYPTFLDLEFSYGGVGLPLYFERNPSRLINGAYLVPLTH